MDNKVKFKVGQHWLKRWHTNSMMLLQLSKLDKNTQRVDYKMWFSDHDRVDSACTYQELKSWISVCSVQSNTLKAKRISKKKAQMLINLWDEE